MRGLVLIGVLFVFGGAGPCDAEVRTDSRVPASSEDADYSADNDGAPSERERKRGYTMRGEILKPIDSKCARWSAKIGGLEAGCAKELFVDVCGETDADNKPTGKYEKGACASCDALFGARNDAREDGC